MSRKTVKPGHVVETDAEATGTALDAMQENESGAYAPGLAPLASEAPPESAAHVAPEPEASPEASQTTTDESEGADPATNTPEDEADVEAENDEPVCVVLVGGGSFRQGDAYYTKGVPVLVPAEIAERLIATGLFEGR